MYVFGPTAGYAKQFFGAHSQMANQATNAHADEMDSRRAGMRQARKQQHEQNMLIMQLQHERMQKERERQMEEQKRREKQDMINKIARSV